MQDGTARRVNEVYVRGMELKNVQLPNIILDEALAIEKSRLESRAALEPRKDIGRGFGRSNTRNSGQQGRSVYWKFVWIDLMNLEEVFHDFRYVMFRM